MLENQLNNESTESKVIPISICEECGVPVPAGVARFSRNNFEGHIFCMRHQKAHHDELFGLAWQPNEQELYQKPYKAPVLANCEECGSDIFLESNITWSKDSYGGHIYCFKCSTYKDYVYTDALFKRLLQNSSCFHGFDLSAKEAQFAESFLVGFEETVIGIASEYWYWSANVTYQDKYEDCYHDKITIDEALEHYTDEIVGMAEEIRVNAAKFEAEYENKLQNIYVRKLIDFIKANAELIARNAFRLNLIRVNSHPEDDYRNYLSGYLYKAPSEWLRENLKLFHSHAGYRFTNWDKDDKELEIWFRGEIAEEVTERLRFDDQSVPYKHCGWGLPSEKEFEYREKWTYYFLEEKRIREKYQYLYDDLAVEIYHEHEEWCDLFDELKARPWPNDLSVDENLAMRYVYWVYKASAMIMGHRDCSIEL
jgi:hypothetical protein